ncbi:MAG TPA: hypothetical protein ENG95_04900 [Nitrospirae bacterium]|nr:hypothetical protein BMS3Abin10_00343 [bacterium BMS3Abin10]GBE40107.1 hypothetical protein BMS3Bbin08_02745 [bacterium BMS3Bbin08]HDH50766.1 hypothetical protein [Nitrospirota bacterium]HDO25957.1 hypothetical protein [Nitrospirota bacterium]HDZ84544.1 hypothetical protein [Nitrospirota bacterium]
MKKSIMMKKIPCLLLGMLLLALIPSVATAADEGIGLEFEVLPWYTDLEFNSKLSTLTSDGSDLDHKSALKLGDETLINWRLTWRINPDHTLRFSYIGVDFEGNTIISKNLTLEGQSFAAGSRLVTDIDFSLLEFSWIWNFLSDKYISIGTLVEVKGLFMDTELFDPVSLVKQQDELTTAIPFFGIAVSSEPFKFINIFGEASGIYVDQKNYGYAYDAEAGIKIIPLDYVTISGGYRILRINAEDVPDYLDFEIQGPFVSLGIRF